MLYMDYIYKVKELVLEQTDDGVWYLEPEWRYILAANDMASLELSDFQPGWDIVEDNLKLEVKKRNLSLDRKKLEVIDWLHETITATVEPAMLSEETDYIKQVIEFMKQNHENQGITQENS